jgi:signal transduction histidine kinase
VREETEFFLSRTPAQVSTLRQVVEALEQSSELIIQRVAAALDRTLQVHAQRLERIRSLQADFPMLRLDPSTWQIYGDGDNAWLVSMSPRQPNAASMVIAIDSASVFSTVKTENPFPWKIRIRDGNSGESLGEALPGLSVSFDAIESRGTRSVELYRMYYLLSLGLVLAVTALGGYLVWRDMRRELKVAEMRSQFVSSVSHELKTPLTAIRMFVDTLRFRKPEDTKTQEQCLETISQESERLTRLVDNVLDFSRIERGQKTYQLQPVSLASVITSSTRAVQYGLTQEGFRLRVSLPDTLPPIFADRDAVEQAILNLLTNAMKYSGDSRDIDIDVRVEASAALIRVSDRGIGIPVHEQSRIFEKFYRATTPENRGIPGTGLGLALVVHIARAHGGTIAVESIPGQGSTFTLRLPLVTAAGASGGNHL